MSGDGETPTLVTRVDQPARRGRLDRWRGRGERWLGLIVVLAAVAVKVNAYRDIVHHRAAIVTVLGAAVIFSVVRPRPVVFALLAAPFVAVALHPHPVLAGVGLGLGVFALLMVLFFGVATVLHIRQHRR